jgi:hypothetical protein
MCKLESLPAPKPISLYRRIQHLPERFDLAVGLGMRRTLLAPRIKTGMFGGPDVSRRQARMPGNRLLLQALISFLCGIIHRHGLPK